MDIATAVRDRRGWLDALSLPELKSPAAHKTFAKDAISAVFDMQAPDGFIPHRMNPVDGSDITQPPILALGAQLVAETAGDGGWLAKIYPRLCAFLEWIFSSSSWTGIPCGRPPHR